ncbi:hypothetical protein PGTUg99_031563 [Puccinia graminis f. sp. tritici]|uniref:Uncharacterized protein n=1 Tax=Puccinia graminis f. sp. tritici TaxID=56615 RepID=A0A5B0QUI3_PUCGR|nr:hypothetical protein PGTUg99_031563 [Puccinia graminis f. sp. tritici]
MQSVTKTTAATTLPASHQDQPLRSQLQLLVTKHTRKNPAASPTNSHPDRQKKTASRPKTPRHHLRIRVQAEQTFDPSRTKQELKLRPYKQSQSLRTNEITTHAQNTRTDTQTISTAAAKPRC